MLLRVIVVQVRLTQEEDEVEPAGEVVPVGQEVQVMAPATSPYVPRAQRVQEDAPLPLNLPEAHCAHEEEDGPPLGWYCPVGQIKGGGGGL